MSPFNSAKSLIQRLTFWGIFDKDASTTDSIGVKEDAESAPALKPAPGFLAGSLHIDFEMNLFGMQKKIGGLAGVGTAMLFKKQGLAKDLVLHFLDQCDQKGYAMAALHPFRPDFYYQMGFGFSSPNYEYSIRPSSFPKSLPSVKSMTGKVTQLSHTDTDEMVLMCNTYADSHHGAFYMNSTDIKKFVWDSKNLAFGYRDASGALQGLVSFDFRKPDPTGFMPNDMIVSWFMYNTTEALAGLLNFLRTQEDQVRYVVMRTQDGDLPFLVKDVRVAGDEFRYLSRCGLKTSDRGTAMMFRIVNLHNLFSSYLADHNFNGVSIRLLIKAEDTFVPKNENPVLVEFRDGKPTVVSSPEQAHADSDADTTLELTINNLASLVVGSVTLKSLINHGLATVTPNVNASKVGKLFQVESSPVNFIEF
ncbi:sterol carrier protein domain-containing protein [Chytridium lagenaria]|nr:sterol carrier protein domain-containing protein [Chytridium lagenaria]